jgi:hypothetical protein
VSLALFRGDSAEAEVSGAIALITRRNGIMTGKIEIARKVIKSLEIYRINPKYSRNDIPFLWFMVTVERSPAPPHSRSSGAGDILIRLTPRRKRAQKGVKWAFETCFLNSFGSRYRHRDENMSSIIITEREEEKRSL